MTKRPNIKPLSKKSLDRIARMRAADAAGESSKAVRISIEDYTRSELAAALRRCK